MVTTQSGTLAQVFAAEDASVTLAQMPTGLVAAPLERILPCRWQPRQVFEPGALLDLANDIAIHGVLTPPLVWENEEGEFELIAGERRVRACYALFMLASAGEYSNRKLESWVDQAAKEGFAAWRADVKRLRYAHEQGLPGGLSQAALERSFVHCRQIWGTAAELHELALVDNLQRADLSALEEARALQDLVNEYGYSQRDLGRRLGKSQTWISQRLLLLNLAPEIAEQVTGGEIDSATAREIARLEPAVQGAAVAHLKQFGLKSKQAQNLVQRVVELSQPEALAGQDLNANAARQLARLAMTQLPDEASRQAAVLKYAAQDSKGVLAAPKEEHKYKDLIAATGLAGEGKTRYDMQVDQVWKQRAPAAGYTCENCRMNAHRETVERIQGLAVGHGERWQLNDTNWPRCGAGVTTCAAFVGEGDELRLPVPGYGIDQAIPDEARPFVTDAYPKRATTVAAWAAIFERFYQLQDEAAAQRSDARDNGLQRSLAAYFEAQAGPEAFISQHFWSQPCGRCVFHKVDAEDPAAHCQFQANPQEWDSYEPNVARLWTSGNATIGRCRLFRLKAADHLLPDLAPGIPALGEGGRFSADVMIYLLEPQSEYQGDRRGAAWLDAQRTRAWVAPTWTATVPVLRKLIPLLTPGQRLALMLLWRDPFGWLDPGWGKTAVTAEAYTPGLGVINWELTRTIKR